MPHKKTKDYNFYLFIGLGLLLFLTIKWLPTHTIDEIPMNNELKEQIGRIDSEIATFQKMLINGTLSSTRAFTEAELILNFAKVGLQSCGIPWWLTDSALLEFMTRNTLRSNTLHIGVWSHFLTQNYNCLKIAYKRLGFTLKRELGEGESAQLHYTIQREAFALAVYAFTQGYEYTYQIDAFLEKRFYYSNFYIDSSNYFPIPSTYPLYSREQYGKDWEYKFSKSLLPSNPTHNELIPCEQPSQNNFDSWIWSLSDSPQMHGMAFLKSFFEKGLGLPIILCQESLFYWLSQECQTDHEATKAVHFGILVETNEDVIEAFNEYEMRSYNYREFVDLETFLSKQIGMSVYAINDPETNILAAYKIKLNQPDLTVYIHALMKYEEHLELSWFQQVSTWDFQNKAEYRVIKYPKPAYFARADLESTLFLVPNNARDWLNIYHQQIQELSL